MFLCSISSSTVVLKDGSTLKAYHLSDKYTEILHVLVNLKFYILESISHLLLAKCTAWMETFTFAD